MVKLARLVVATVVGLNNGKMGGRWPYPWVS